MNRYTASIAFAIFIPLLLISSQQVFAVPHTLTDENAVVVIEDGAGGSNAGVTSYTVDGVNHMVQEAWWFRSSTTAVEVPIASFGVISAVATDEDLDGDDDKLVITYTPATFGLNVLTVTYELTGGAPGSGIANLFERVFPSVPQFSTVDFYLYTNFDAEGNPINTAVRTAVDTVDQGVSGPPFATTTIMDTPTEVEFNSPASLLARLNDASPDTFVDTPVSNSFGPADAAFVAHHVRSSGMFVPASPIEVNKQIQSSTDTDGDGISDGLDPDPNDPCNPNITNSACDFDGDGIFGDVDPDNNDPCNPNTTPPCSLEHSIVITSFDGDDFPAAAIDGNIAVVTEDRDDDFPAANGFGAGSVHLYEVSTGNFLRTINHPFPPGMAVTGGAHFGASVDIDGDNLVVGSLGFNDESYLFSASTGALLQTFVNPTGELFDLFGDSVAIQGNRVVIGAPRPGPFMSGLEGPGHAYMFDATNGNMLFEFTNPSPDSGLNDSFGDQFGDAVDIDGNNVVIGAPFNDPPGSPFPGHDVGTVYQYDTSGILLNTHDNPKLPISDGIVNADRFGSAVSISGNKFIVGAPEDFGDFAQGFSMLFDTSGNPLHTFLNPTPNLSPGFGDCFGNSVVIDGNNIGIGAPCDISLPSGPRGVVYEFDATTFELNRTIKNPSLVGSGGFDFGRAVACDAENLLVQNDSEAFLYDKTPLAPSGIPVPPGQNVNVEVPNPAPGIDSIEFTFDDVTQGGDITVDSSQGCPPNMGFQLVGLGGSPACITVDFDGTFTGNVVIKITYDDTGLTIPQEQSLSLWHFNSGSGMWEDITDSVDTVLNMITGTTTGFSFFGIFNPIVNGATPIGGEMIPLDATMVLAAGAQYTAAWMIPVLVSAIGIGIVIARKF